MAEKPTSADEKMLAMNEALMLAVLRQHELTEAADSANVQLRAEIAERKRAQFLVNSQKQALQLLAEDASLQAVLEFLIGVVERERGEGMLAAITLLNEAGTHFQRGISTSLPEAFNAAVEGVEVSSPTELCALAVRRREPMAVNDLKENAEWQAFGQFVARYGLRSGWCTPIVSSGGRILGTFANYFCHACDPTPKNQELVEMVIRTAAVAIERKRAEELRERLLANEQQARKQADEANRVKDEFLATISHELRTPLNAIMGWTEILVRGKLDEETASRGLKTIARNAKAQMQLISDLLDVSRIISGQLRFESGVLELAPIIEAAVDSVRPAAEAKNIELRLQLEPLAGMVWGDAGRLQQIVSNLLTNAIKYTSKNGRVAISLERVVTSLVIKVTDTGEGISPEFLPYIFDRFRQADSASTRDYGGLGLGLAIVRHLVEAHGGSVSAASEGPGLGATFTVTLPLASIRKEEGGIRKFKSGELSKDQISSSLALKDVTVLVVADDSDARDLLTIALKQSGADVRSANNVRAALKILDQWKPDVLISDIGMPGVDGYAFMRKVRARKPERGGRIPALAVTGYAGVDDAERALKAGNQTHMPKPV